MAHSSEELIHRSLTNEGEFDVSCSLPLLDVGSHAGFNQNSFATTILSHPELEAQRSANEAQFYKLPTQEVHLSSLQRIYERKDQDQALCLLNKKITIKLDDSHKLSAPALATFTSPEHNLDFLLLVPREPGLDVLLPPFAKHHSPSWFFEMDFSRPMKQLSVKHGMLGFAAEESALYCGRVGQDLVYLCVVDQEVSDSAVPQVPAGRTIAGPTNMPRRLLRICQSWLLYGLSKTGLGGIWCEPEDYYQVSLDDSSPDWSFAIGFTPSTMHTLQLREQDIEHLHENWNLDSWKEFVLNAPPSWKMDRVLTSMPIFMLMSYGQDMALNVWEDPSPSVSYFESGWRWEKMRWVSFALASQLRAHRTEYTPIPVEELQRRHGQIYRSKRAHHEDLIHHPEDEPLEDDVGYELKFFDQHGRRIRRRTKNVDVDDPTSICGILLNLRTVDEMMISHSLYNPYHNSDVFISNPAIHKYSMAFIRDAGQIQSRQPLPLLTSPLREVNELIASREDSNNAHTLDEDGNVVEAAGPALPAVFNVSFQIYNRMLHFIAPRANEHEAICGHVTAALGGEWANNPSDKTRAEKAQAKIQRRLPHERLQLASSSGHASKDLRVEPVYVMDMNKVHPDHRNGRSFWEDVILPLTAIWTNGNFLKGLVPHLIIFKPAVFPHLFSWTTYGVGCLIKALVTRFHQEQANAKKSGGAGPQYCLELIAVAERLLAFGYTGSARVLVKDLMQPLWTTLALTAHTTPMLNPNIIGTTSGPASIRIQGNRWPLQRRNDMPGRASNTALELTYSSQLAHSYDVNFMFLHSQVVPPPNLFPRRQDTPQLRYGLIILYLAIKGLLLDLTFMIQEGVRVDSAMKRTQDPIQYTEDWEQGRQQLVTAWAKSEHPWSFQGTHYQPLVKALIGHSSTQPGQQHLPGLGGSVQITGAKVAEAIFSQIDKEGNVKPSAPLVKQGAFKFVLPALLQHLSKLAPPMEDKDSFQAAKDWAPSLFELALVELKVEFLPWKSTNSGPRRSYAVFDSYINCRGISTDLSLPISQASSSSTPQTLTLPPPSNPLSGTWYIAHSNLTTLSQYFFHHRLPSDTEYPGSPVAIWVTLREWVTNFPYSPDNFHQHLALIIAIFMNRLSPDVQFPGSRSFQQGPGQSLFQAMRGVPWGAGRKVAQRTPGGATFGTWYLWILACIHPNSPLRQRLNSADATLGQDIMDVLNNRGVTTAALLKIGILQIIGTKFNGGQYNKTWTFQTEQALRQLYDTIKSALTDQSQYRLGHLAIMILAEDGAQKLAQSEGLLLPSF